MQKRNKYTAKCMANIANITGQVTVSTYQISGIVYASTVAPKSQIFC